MVASGDAQVKMENHKRRCLTCAEEDIINNLAEHLIDSILERLPFQDVVRTSILSKQWRYRWTRMRVLVLDEKFSKKIAKNGAYGRNGLIQIINQILILHKGPISKFSLHIPKMYLYSFEEIHQLMLCLSKISVRELVLTNSNQRYELPSYVFSFLDLRKLELENCIFKPPLEFNGNFNVENLFLKDVDFGANSWEDPFSLPHLKRLCLQMCTNVCNFNIKARKLKTLLLAACPDANVLPLLDSPCLTAVALSFRKRINDLERMNLAMLLSNLPKIEHFYIDGPFSKILSADKIPKWLPHAVNSLKHLSLIYFQLGDLDQLHSALCLLRNSPNLKSLYMNLTHKKPRVMHYDLGPASNHLEAPCCLDQTLKKLRTVEIEVVEGSRPELLFIKLLLAHSPSLKKLIIRSSGLHDAQNWFNIAKDIMQFPRASPKAETIYLNPKP